MQQCNVAIVGCGLGGVATAIAIRRAGHRVTVYEKALAPSEIGAGIQLPHNCTQILKNWGILPAIESYATQPSNVLLRRYRDGRILFRRRNPAIHEGGTQTPHLLLHRADFLNTLTKEANRLEVSFHFGATVTKIDFERPAIRLSDGDEYEFDVIFGADGPKSFCRGLLFGSSHGPKFSGDVAYRMMVPVIEVRKHQTLLPLVDDSDISCWMGPQSHVVCYRLREESMLNIVLTGPYHSSGLADNAESYGQEVESLLTNWDPQLQKLCRLAKSVLKRRLQGSHEMASWIHPGGRFALLGDACHTSLPHLAQGAAQAVEDGAVLGELLARIQDKGQIKNAVQLYEAIRKPRTARVTAGSNKRRNIYQLCDGKAQQERDEELAQENSLDRYPKCIEDPEFESWLLEYNTATEVEIAWQKRVVSDC